MFESVRERPQPDGSWALGIAAGAMCGLIGIVLVLALGGRNTWRGVLVGFVARLGAIGIAVAVFLALSQPERVTHEDCRCSFMLARGMSDGPIEGIEDADFMASSGLMDVYLMDTVKPKSESWEVPPVGMAHLLAEALAPGRELEIEPLGIGGFSAAQFELVQPAEHGEPSLYFLVTVIETPTNVHQVLGWTLASQQESRGAMLREIVASFQAYDQPEPGLGWSTELREVGLLEARAGVEAAHRPPPWEASPAPRPPRGVFERIRYTAPLGRNVAYLTPDPGDGQRHPAVLWAHGGFGGIDSWFWEEAPPWDDQSAAAFREAGIVLMVPSWRGENDNPGGFEQFFGEVEDLLAARDHLASRPYVDPNRIYLAGHSTGGTLTLLAAASTADFRAAFSIGGAPNLFEVRYGEEPYAEDDEEQIELRSAMVFTPAIEQPTYYFEGADSGYVASAKLMAAMARGFEVPFEAWAIEGHDHFTVLAPLTRGLAATILADDPSRPFQLHDHEVQSWFEAP